MSTKSAHLAYEDKKSLEAERKTFICFGCPRGGTSMVAGLIQGLGIDLGQNLPNNFEDPDFVAKGKPHLLKSIKERNASKKIWGWKFPNAANYLDNIFSELHNPRYVIVYRDLVATSIAHTRWHGRGFDQAMSENLVQQMKNNSISERHRVPTLFVSYDQAVAERDVFVANLASFLGADVPDDKSGLISFMEPGSYKYLNEKSEKTE